MSEIATLIITVGLIVLGGWVILALVVGLVVGAVIRNRDKQIPKPNAWESKDMQGLRPDSQESSSGTVPGPEMLDTPPRGQKSP